jgi:hypothetical protein
MDANTGVTVATAMAQTGSYAFGELPDGQYYVYAGQDETGDRIIGVPVRRWGSWGGSAKPSSVTVHGAGGYAVNFDIGFPIEGNPNHTLADADVLPVGGYLLGTIDDPSSEMDVFMVRVPATGSYVFETSSPFGACGFAYEEDTILGLYDAAGNLISSNDDIDAGSLNYCSRITETLEGGVYYLAVVGYYGGRYAISAREGS